MTNDGTINLVDENHKITIKEFDKKKYQKYENLEYNSEKTIYVGDIELKIVLCKTNSYLLSKFKRKIMYEYELNSNQFDKIDEIRFKFVESRHVRKKINQCNQNNLKDNIQSSEENDSHCIICSESIKNRYALVPCGHTNVCASCILTFDSNCPTCKQKVKQCIKLFNIK